MFCVERYLALTDPLHHYARKRKIGVIGTISLIFAGCAISSVYAPIAYYWQMENTGANIGAQVRLIPDDMLRWKEFDIWFEVQTTQALVCVSDCVFV